MSQRDCNETIAGMSEVWKKDLEKLAFEEQLNKDYETQVKELNSKIEGLKTQLSGRDAEIERLEKEASDLRRMNTYEANSVEEFMNSIWALVYPDDPTGWDYPGQIINHARQEIQDLRNRTGRYAKLPEDAGWLSIGKVLLTVTDAELSEIARRGYVSTAEAIRQARVMTGALIKNQENDQP